MLTPALDRAVLTRRAVLITAAVALSLILPIAAVRATAQDGSRTLNGVVYDATGGVMPGVTVLLADPQDVKWNRRTDGTGRFDFGPMGPGKYVLELSLRGFKPLRQELELTNAKDWKRAIRLDVGSLAETVTVTGKRPSETRPAPAPPRGPVRVGGYIRQPRKIFHVNPIYPQAMQDAGVEGMVPIEAVIGTDGRVIVTRVLDSRVHPALAQAATDAVRQWRFDATLLNNVPIEVLMVVSVSFSLQD